MNLVQGSEADCARRELVIDWSLFHWELVIDASSRPLVKIDRAIGSPTLQAPIVKILVLSNLYPPHHAGTYDFRVQTITEAMQSRGHTVRVLTSKHGMNIEQRSAEVERRLLLNGVYEHPTVTRLDDLWALEKANHKMLRETLEAFAPDVVHVHSLAGLSKSLIFALRQARLPTVYDVADHWLAEQVRTDPWLRWWNRPAGPAHQLFWRACLELAGQRNQLDSIAPTRMMKGYDRIPEVYGEKETLARVAPDSIAAFRFDRLYFCSQSLREATAQAGFRVGHGEVIYPGIPTQQFVGEMKPASAPATKFLIVGRLDAKSGVLTAIKALEAAQARGVKGTLSVYGRGDSDYIAEARSYIAMHQLPVEFLPISNINRDLPAIYKRHDVFLHTSEWNEPFAPTPLEAMASGLPVIASEKGGVSELLRPEENAWTYPAGDVDTLAACLAEVQSKPEMRCRIVETAQQEVLSKYNETAVADRIENYLQTSLEVWGHNSS
jgi:glycogen(starch) synthase